MKHIFIFIILWFVSNCNAQFNSKVGYTVSSLSMNSINGIFQEFDSQNTFLADKLEKMKLAHGLEFGIRYRAHNLSLELGILTQTANAKATGINPITTAKDDIRWKASIFDYHLGLTQHINNFGFGAAITNTRLTMKEYNTVSTDYVEITKQHNWGLKVFVQLEMPDKYTSFALRPFYQFGFDTYDESLVQSKLAPTYTGDTNEDLKMFGLSILFFNGTQQGY